MEQRVKLLETQMAASERKRANLEETALLGGLLAGDSASVQGGGGGGYVRGPGGVSLDGGASVLSRQSTVDGRRAGAVSKSASMVSRSLQLMAAAKMATAKAAREKELVSVGARTVLWSATTPTVQSNICTHHEECSHHTSRVRCLCVPEAMSTVHLLQHCMTALPHDCLALCCCCRCGRTTLSTVWWLT